MTGRHRLERADGQSVDAILGRVAREPFEGVIATVSLFDGSRLVGHATGPLVGLLVPVHGPATVTSVRVTTDGEMFYEGPVRAQAYTRDGSWTLQGALVDPPAPAGAVHGTNHSAHSAP